MNDFNLPLSRPSNDDSPYTNAARSDFLADLDDASHIDLTDFETFFIESNISRKDFSPRQRDVIDSMRKKYGSRL